MWFTFDYKWTKSTREIAGSTTWIQGCTSIVLASTFTLGEPAGAIMSNYSQWLMTMAIKSWLLCALINFHCLNELVELPHYMHWSVYNLNSQKLPGCFSYIHVTFWRAIRFILSYKAGGMTSWAFLPSSFFLKGKQGWREHEVTWPLRSFTDWA